MKKFFLKDCNGITLVALVVTIIVLLILAGVSLNLVAGSNGILNRASNAVSKTKEAQLKEELQLGLAEIMMDYYIEGNGKSLQEYIIEQCNKLGNDGMLEVGNGMFSSVDGELYYTDSNGNVSMIQVTDKGEVSIEGSVSADGTVNDSNPPSIFATATTNTISLVIKDPLSGVAGWAYSETNEKPNTWNEIAGNPKSYNETMTGLKNGTTYYIWAKDANGNETQVREVRTKDFEELSYDITWEGATAIITVKTPTTGVQYLDAGGNWIDYTTPVSVESATTVQFKVTDGNNEEQFEAIRPLKTSTITYNVNGGTGNVPSAQTAEHTNNVTVNFETKPSKSGMRFIGWSTNSNTGANPDTAEYAENGTNNFVMPNTDVTLYAVYQNATPVYGTSISSDYGTSIYTNENTRVPFSEGKPIRFYSGNYGYIETMVNFVGPYIHSKPAGESADSGRAMIVNGRNTNTFVNAVENKWIEIEFWAASHTGIMIYVSDLKLIFSDGSQCTVNEAVKAGKIAPLVLCTSWTYTQEKYNNYVWKNVMNLINGGKTDERTFPNAEIMLKVNPTHRLSGISFNTNNAWDTRIDGLRVKLFDNLELSTEPF